MLLGYGLFTCSPGAREQYRERLAHGTLVRHVPTIVRRTPSKRRRACAWERLMAFLSRKAGRPLSGQRSGPLWRAVVVASGGRTPPGSICQLSDTEPLLLTGEVQRRSPSTGGRPSGC